jgi:hypothetical protein
MSTTFNRSDELRHLIIKSKRSTAVMEVVGQTILKIHCDNRPKCRLLGIKKTEDCPKYCEFVVAARDHLRKVRKPKLQVTEI